MASVTLTPGRKDPGFTILYYLYIYFSHLFSDLVTIVGTVVVGVGALALVVLEAEGGLHQDDHCHYQDGKLWS